MRSRHRPPESLLFAEFWKKFFAMTYLGSTRVVDQASAHSLPLTVAGRHIALAVAGRHIALNPTDSTHGNRNPLDLNCPFWLKKAESSGLPRFPVWNRR